MNEYTPDRADIVWLDFEPKKGSEIGKYRPALILSSKAYAKKTGMVIYSPISTSIRGGLTEVPIDGLEYPSVVAAAIVNTLSYKARKVKLITRTTGDVVNEVLSKLLPLMGHV